MAENFKVKYSVVVPVYNSENSLKLLHERLADVFKSLNVPWELILVNDCSRDSSWRVMREIAENDEKVTAINLTNNFGQQNALMCGLAIAKGEYIITMDDDLQHPPKEISKLIKTIHDGNYDVAYGQYSAENYGWFRSACSEGIKKILASIAGSGYRTTSFRIIKKEVVDKIVGFKQFNAMIDVLIKDIVSSSRVGHCAVEHRPREIGTSNYSFKKLFAYATNMIFNYTSWPLRLASILGLFFSFVSVVLGIYFFLEYMTKGISVRGWTTMIIIITFFFGITLFVLGIIGEYIGRIFLNINQKPQYFVKEVYKKHE